MHWHSFSNNFNPHAQHWQHHWYSRRMFCRGPSRLIWFIIGGVTTAWWMKCKEHHWHRYPANVENGVGAWNRRLMDNARGQDNSASWDEERARMRELARQANDAMSDMSESALDSVLTNIQSLKGKLAEKRIAREREYQEQLEREKVNRRS